jgi:hypothetical protein
MASNRRGRPSKFGRPSQVVALTLPDDVIRGLRRIDPDVAWAIVSLFEKSPSRRAGDPSPHPDVELVTIADRRSLIVVNRAVIQHLRGVNIIRLHGDRAFLALDEGRGMADLELAVLDSLEGDTIEPRERTALKLLRQQLRAWRHDRSLRFHAASIIIVEHTAGRRRSS